MQEHELGHDLRQRIGLHHLYIGGMNRSIVVVQVCGISLVVEFFLNKVHALKVLDIVWILHRLTIFRVGKLVDNELPIPFRVGEVATPVVEQIHIIIGVEAIGVVRVALEQLFKLVGCCWQVFKFVFQDYAHVVQAFLNNIVRRLYLFFGLRNLLQVVFLVVWVFGALESFFIHLSGVAFGHFGRVGAAVGIFFGGVLVE